MKIMVWIDNGLCGCGRKDYIDIDDDEWNEMTKEEREARLDEEAIAFRDNTIEIGAKVI